MDRDLDPALEASARRQLSALGAAVAVPPATAPPGVPGVDPDPALPGPRPHPRHHPRRPLVLAGVGAVGAIAVAAAVGAVVLARDDDSGRLSMSSISPDRCEPQVADDGIVGAGELPDGGRWQARVQGEPPHITTTALIDGSVVGATYGDGLSRATVVDRGFFGIHAELTERATIVWGEVPRTTDHVVVGTDDATEVACPATVPADELVGYFAVALPTGPATAEDGIDVEAVDGQARLLASGTLEPVEPPEVPSGTHTHMTVDPSLVPLPLGSAAAAATNPAQPAAMASRELPGGTWTLVAGAPDELVGPDAR